VRVWQAKHTPHERAQFARRQILLSNLNALDTAVQRARDEFEQWLDAAR
jgi:hypothetical protein